LLRNDGKPKANNPNKKNEALMLTPIADYALLGNLRCAALVSRAGSIDWFCPDKFDAPACFAAILGRAEHGHWIIAPRDQQVTVQRHYQEDTLILETIFTTPSGKVKITDFMPLNVGCQIVRSIEGLTGKVAMFTRCVARFNYGEVPASLIQPAVDTITFNHDGGRLSLNAPDIPLTILNSGVSANFLVHKGERYSFVMAYANADSDLPVALEPDDAIKECADWWHQWLAQCDYSGRWEPLVKRSLITLKALTYEPSGGMVAAPTTSLPEVPGGEANYDYRYCWLRDAAFALKVLLNAGFKSEAEAWLGWLLKAVNQHDEPLHALYTIEGTVAGNEHELHWLPGYLDSRPVRSGNAASRQYQLDIRGELMEVFHLARSNGLNLSAEIWQLQCEILADLSEHWREPDTGIWEFRTIKDHLTHSKVLAWVAYDRCIRDAERFGFPAPMEKWCSERDAIRQDVLEHGIHPDGGFFTQRYGSPDVDASLLMIPLVGFVAADDPRMLATISEIEKDLCEHGLVRRYRTGDQANVEGLFLACCFWLADNYWLAGRKQDAEALFKRLLNLCNDVGLLAEEYDPQQQQFLGNFPQGLSHLALISTARLISEANADAVSLD
jgi:GH15 family glucan-1,4-alpha-glucosidase